MPPRVDPIISVPGIRRLNQRYESRKLIYSVCITLKATCPKCNARGQNLRLKQCFKRLIQHESIADKPSFFELEQRKFQCRRCHTYFREPIPGVLQYQRTTEPGRYQQAWDHHHGYSKDAVAKKFRISSRKVDRSYEHLQARHLKEVSNQPCPRVLGIDEHFLNRKVGYVTTFVNLGTRRVFELAPGRSERALEHFLLRLKGRERVRVVVMDLSSTYRSIVQKYFPNAMIVADRFHVVRLINHSLLNLWKRFDEKGRKNRGLLSLMRRHRFKLSLKQRESLASYFSQYPAIGALYGELKSLIELVCFKHQTAKQCRQFLIPRLLKTIGRLKSCPIDEVQTLAKTLSSWLEPIARMWRFTKTNSITEGLHNKMELIQRRAYGFHSFKNYRIRVLALCG